MIVMYWRSEPNNTELSNMLRQVFKGLYVATVLLTAVHESKREVADEIANDHFIVIVVNPSCRNVI